MSEPIEARILALAEAAAEEWPASGGIPVDEIDNETETAQLGDKTTALISALSAPTVSRLARVVEAARRLNSFPVIDLYESDQIVAFDALTDAVAALDADAPEGGRK